MLVFPLEVHIKAPMTNVRQCSRLRGLWLTVNLLLLHLYCRWWRSCRLQLERRSFCWERWLEKCVWMWRKKKVQSALCSTACRLYNDPDVLCFFPTVVFHLNERSKTPTRADFKTTLFFVFFLMENIFNLSRIFVWSRCLKMITMLLFKNSEITCNKSWIQCRWLRGVQFISEWCFHAVVENPLYK